MPNSKNSIDLLRHNQIAWDRQATNQNEWSRPVSSEQVENAKKGNWEVYLTPMPVPKNWFNNINGKKILCLASAGGQQAPILAAAGAEVTVYDLSEEQLNQDRMVAQRDNLNLTAIQGDMCDLGIFKDGSFDLIFHPISNHYIANVNLVWQECYRILAKGGTLLASFYNPVVFVSDRDPTLTEQGLIRPTYRPPYADIKDLSAEKLKEKQEKGEAFVFGHTLSDLIAGQIAAGFTINQFKEDFQPNPRFLIDQFLPTFLATSAIK